MKKSFLATMQPHRLLLAALLSASASAIAWGADYKTLVVERTDGSQLEITLSDNLAMKFEDRDFVVNGDDGAITMPVEAVAGFHVSELPAGIDENRADVLPEGEITATGVRFTQLPVGAVAEVFDAAGRKVHSATSTGGELVMPFGEMAPGVNLIRVNGISIKVVRP